MIEVISVRFRGGCKSYFFNPQGIQVREGDEVIVETAQGAEFGTCVYGNHPVEEFSIIQPLRPMHRLATDEDRKTVERNRKREKDAFAICEKKIAEHQLEMKLVNVECGFEGSKIIFFFTADGRVDFRELVKDLASVFRARIELRQIGVRDEAKMLGGLGICGQPFCCKRFLDDFQPVSIKMAKTQNLSLTPSKISGSCGRLMCCLKYEQYAYEDAQTRMPKNDSFVQTPDGPGNINSVNLVRETVTVRLDDMPESPRTYHTDEIIVLRNGKGSREGIRIPDRPAKRDRESELEEISISALSAAQFNAGYSGEGCCGSEGGCGNCGGDHAAPAQNSTKRDTADRGRAGSNNNNNKGGGDRGSRGEGQKSGERAPASHRPHHRGSRPHKGGEAPKENGQNSRPRQERPERQERPDRKPGGEAQQPRPVRFGASMPMAGNAPQGGEKSGEQKSGRRPHRPFHRSHGSRGSKGEGGGSKEG